MPIRIGTPRPELSAVEWINGAPEPSALSGRPLLVHFWSVSCHLCHVNMPMIAAWREEFASAGLAVVSFHVPRSEGDRDERVVREHVRDLGIVEPCGLDHRLATFEAFQNTFVPSYYLFDANGHLRNRAGGSAGLLMMRTAIERELAAFTSRRALSAPAPRS